MDESKKLKTLQGKKILITGGLGFIGSNVAHRCLALGAEVTVYDCLDPRGGGNMHNIAGIKNSIHLIVNDVRSFEGISACIRNQDILFNCAAYTSHPNSMKEPLIDIDVNCKGAINILEAARRFNPELKIVHIGTSTQIGRMHVQPIDEFHSEFPIDIYSANKSASEKYSLIYGRAYGMRTTVIRLANTYGPRSSIKSPEFGFMNYFIGLGLQNKVITVYGEGKQLRNVTFVDDSVQALILASQSEEVNNQVCFSVAEIQYSVETIAKEIANHIGGTVRFVEWPKEREAIEIGDAVISNAKITKLLNWSPEVNLQVGLMRTKQYYAACLTKYL